MGIAHSLPDDSTVSCGQGGNHHGFTPGNTSPSFMIPVGVLEAMTPPEESTPADDGLAERIGRLAVSIVVLTGVTVVLGYCGWILLTITATAFGYDPETADGALLRDRLLAWPERNRDVMRTNGRTELPLKP